MEGFVGFTEANLDNEARSTLKWYEFHYACVLNVTTGWNTDQYFTVTTHYVCVVLVVWQVKGVMVQNIDKVTQRGDKLEDLGERAGEGKGG